MSAAKQVLVAQKNKTLGSAHVSLTQAFVLSELHISHSCVCLIAVFKEVNVAFKVNMGESSTSVSNDT